MDEDGVFGLKARQPCWLLLARQTAEKSGKNKFADEGF
jgi:hypothetical protein